VPEFRVEAPFAPAGDQPAAIETLVTGLREQLRAQVLLGVTGSGKTFTMANVIARWGRPTLVISHNKTLAAQLYAELRDFLPDNAVEYFVSYYDYYQPEAYIPARDLYIEKDSQINQDIDRLRLAATSSLLTRPDVVVVASVSCIYGLGSPEDYADLRVRVSRDQPCDREDLLEALVAIQYERNDQAFERGRIRARGDVVEIYPPYREVAYRIELWGDEVEALREIDPVTGEVTRDLDEMIFLPAHHFVMPLEKIERACEAIEAELAEQLPVLRARGKLLEAQRLEMRTRHDLEMLRETGHCPGIENYSRHLSGRQAGEPPACLLDYFPEDFLTIVDESHVMLPQLRGMYAGDRSRKQTLVEYGFRLPSALDNRPLQFEEWDARVGPVIYVSATPAPLELERAHGVVVEQIIRPTGLVDPEVIVQPARGQVRHVLGEITARARRRERSLVTTLTKRMAEDLAEYLRESGVEARYLHSEVKTIERVDLLRDLRTGVFDCLVGVNLLREGLDLPEVTLVAILDADREGFLRSSVSLIQTIGRAARNASAQVILYADELTPSIDEAVEETRRRRDLQRAHNEAHGITPVTIEKAVKRGIEDLVQPPAERRRRAAWREQDLPPSVEVSTLLAEMKAAARSLDFERAAFLRDQITALTAHDRAGMLLEEDDR
jgi:excinuclease ABC subunit B